MLSERLRQLAGRLRAWGMGNACWAQGRGRLAAKAAFGLLRASTCRMPCLPATPVPAWLPAGYFGEESADAAFHGIRLGISMIGNKLSCLISR